jgi:hypothetical protein
MNKHLNQNHLNELMLKFPKLKRLDHDLAKLRENKTFSYGDQGSNAHISLIDYSKLPKRLRTAQSFCVPKADIATQGYDLHLNRYKEVVHEEVEHLASKDILANLKKLEVEIQQGMEKLGALLK